MFACITFGAFLQERLTKLVGLFKLEKSVVQYAQLIFAMMNFRSLRARAISCFAPRAKNTVYDQGDLGSWTANAIAGAFEFDLLLESLTDFVPSRLFI